MPPASSHVWKFFRTGGFDQVSLETGADLLNLASLDQKLWVALSCPVKGLELDEKTLALIDTDKDGRIRVPELLAAIQWAAKRLKDASDLLKESDSFPLTALDDATPEGRAALASARRILASLGKTGAEAITLADTGDTAKIFAATPFNGDGVIPADAAPGAEVKQVIADLLATLGGEPDRSGATGVSQAKVEAFFAECAAFAAWNEQGATDGVQILGAGTAAAFAALKAVRAKVNDYFTRCRLAAFDRRALAALNRQESDYLALATQELTATTAGISSFPLAQIEAGRPLALLESVNPAWADALAALHRDTVAPIFGAARTTLTEDDWAALNAKFAAYEAWLGAKAGTAVAPLGLARVQTILAGKSRGVLMDLIARDRAVEPEFAGIAALNQLIRYQRDFRTLLNNFVAFADFYSRDRQATFQAGTLYLDGRSCELCLRVEDPGAHAALAALAKVYIAYCDCRRVGAGETMKIAACFTQGDSDYLMAGRNGVFYDRQGRDWDATITRIIDNPISIRQAFWSPYKKFIRFIEGQIVRRAAAAEAATTGKIEGAVDGAVETAAAGQAPARPKFDVGTVAALGVAVGGISAAFGTILGAFFGLGVWMPVGLLGIIFAISGPSMIIAWLKLRQRNLGPILDANGWAINGRVKINLPFGEALTARAKIPLSAKRSLADPYKDKAARRRMWLAWAAVVAAVVALGVARCLHTCPFTPRPASPAPAAAPAK